MNHSHRISTCLLLMAILSPTMLLAHEGHSHAPSPQTKQRINRLNTETPNLQFIVQSRTKDTARPDIAKLFDPFKGKVSVRFDRDFLFVESNGMPEHSMMTGITAWQQQVPLASGLHRGAMHGEFRSIQFLRRTPCPRRNTSFVGRSHWRSMVCRSLIRSKITAKQIRCSPVSSTSGVDIVAGRMITTITLPPCIWKEWSVQEIRSL